jgi:hypothetical protein
MHPTRNEATAPPYSHNHIDNRSFMRELLAPATRTLIHAMIERAAECWAAGDELTAEGWLTGVLRILDGRPFRDEGAIR